MGYAYIDFETTFSKSVSLTALPVRDYLTHPQTKMLSLALAIDHHPVVVTSNPSIACRWLQQAAAQGHTIVAHNASFDVRVMTILLGLPWPQTVHCTMELAQAWTPNQPGGYSLDNLAKCWLGHSLQKTKIDLTSCTQAELEAYCAQDVEVCRALHQEAMRRLNAYEIRIHEMTQAVKELAFDVDVAAVHAAANGFEAQATQSAADAAALLGDHGAVNYDAGVPRSVKPHEAKRLLLENLGFQTQTISIKKINPEKLRQAADAAKAIDALAQTNKALSNRRRVGTFARTTRIDCELTYFAAHTGRWSSRNTGKGLNLHNLPKRNPLVAKPVRQLFVLPDDLCFVRGDFANVEYRVEGLLTGCQYVIDLFTNDVNADPYAKFWTAATGQPCDKRNPADVPKRQLAKAAVLGLGFQMGLQRWMEELARGLGDPAFGVTLADLDAVCVSSGWTTPTDRRAKAAMTKLGVPWQVAAVAYHTRELFHSLHPEFARAARWLETAVGRVAGAIDPDAALAWAYSLPNALDRNIVDMIPDDTIQGRSLRVRCGHWAHPTVTWRDLLVRDTPFGAGLTFVRAGSRPPARTTINVLIENITQSAARNALCTGLLELDRRGYPYILHVHDEVMMLVPRDRDAVLQARKDMIEVFGPGGYVASKGWDWSAIIKPGDITMSRTLYEDEKWAGSAWTRLAQGDLSVFKELP